MKALKRNLLLSGLACLSFAGVRAQDLIIAKNGNDIRAKVVEISQTEIKYKRFDNLNGPTIVIPKSGVLRINYENGTKEVFDSAPEAAAAPSKQDIRAMIAPKNKVYIQSFDKVSEEAAKDELTRSKKWVLVNAKDKADFIISPTLDADSRASYSGYVEILDPANGKSVYRTPRFKARGFREISGKRAVMEQVIEHLTKM